MKSPSRLASSFFFSFFLFFFLSFSLAACQPQPKSGDTLFADDFSSADSGWQRQSDAEATTDYAPGEYQIEVLAPNLNVWAVAGPTVTDALVQVDARTAGGPDNNLLGIVCRYQDDKNFYFLVVSADGYYAIGKLDDGRIVYLSGGGFQPADEIVRGKSLQHLTASCAGSTLTLSINGEKLAEAADSQFKAGRTGLIAGSFDEPMVDVRFDNFMVTKP